MTIALFGGTGKSGSLLLERLIKEGHSVKTLVRDTKRIDLDSDRLSLIEGNVLDKVPVDQCIAGCDMAYILLGVRSNQKTTLLSEGTANIIRSMEDNGVKRVVLLTSAGVLGRDVSLRVRIMILRYLRHSFRDKKRQLKLLAATGLDWTIVRSTEFKMDKPAGEIIVSHDKARRSSISIISLIEFLYQESDSTKHLQKMPIIGD